MKRFQEQLQSKAKGVKLTSAERCDVKERLQAYMEYHPLPAELRVNVPKKATPQRIAAEPFTVVRIPFGMLFKAAGVACAMVLLVVPFAAERAVPGDNLYAVKVQFNEELRSTLIFNSTEKVEWETERLNRRIAEARLLASEGRLTEEAEAEVAAAVKEHTETAQKEIAQIREVDADEAAIAAIALDTTLEVQSSALKQEQEGNGAPSENANDVQGPSLLATVIDESREQNPTVSSSTPPAYEKLMARVEQNTTRIVELRETVANLASDERLVEVDRRIEDLNRIIAEGINELEADENGARQSLVDALQRSQKLIVFMTEIEMVETIDIETVVPVVLTDEEKVTKRQELLTELTEKREQVVVAISVADDEAVVEKASYALNAIDETLRELASTTAYLVYIERSADAIQLANDTIRTFGSDDVNEPVSEPAVDTGTASPETASTSSEVVGEEQVSAAVETPNVTEEDVVNVAETDVSTSSVDTE